MADHWVCAGCQEVLEPQFEYCWNCGTSYDGHPNPHFVSQRETAEPATDGFGGIPLVVHIVWFLVCATIVFSFAVIADRNLPKNWALHLATTMFLFLSGLLIGVFVNVSGQLYWIIRDKYFSETDRDLVPLEHNPRNSNRTSPDWNRSHESE